MRRLRRLTWIGALLMVVALPLSFYASITSMRGFTLYQTAYYISLIGVIMMALAGFISRPRFFWLVSIILGAAYMASMYGWLFHNDTSFTGMIMVLVPGLGAMLLGVLINRTSGKRKKK